MTKRRAATLTAVGIAAAVVLSACASTADDAGPAVRTVTVTRPAPTATASTPRAVLAGVGARSTTGSAPSAPVTPCTANHHARFVVVDVGRQHVWMCAHHRVAFDSAVTTGAVGLPYDATPTGTFHVQELDRDRTLTLVSGQTYQVRYWIPFDAPLYGFHDATWQTMPFGSPRYRTHGSHGCVHMPLRAMRFLYGWARVGTPVRVNA